MSATEIRNPEVEIDKIHVVEGFNARQDFDPDGELKRLAETVAVNGIIQPLRVKQREDGEFDLVAGERRYQAAKLAGRTTVPITLSTGNPYAEAFIENHHRADLNPIEIALGLEAVAEEFGLTTNAKIAAHQKIGKNRKAGEKFVGSHLRLLELPKDVQRYFAARDVPISAEPKLRKIADVSPDVAALICKVAKAEEVSGNAFVERFGDMLSKAATVAGQEKVTMISVTGFKLSEVISDKAKRKSLADRINPLIVEYHRSEDPAIQLTDSEVDAARAAGCLVEYQPDRGAYGMRYSFVTDRVLAEDLIERLVDGAEQQAAAAAKAAEEKKAKRKDEKKDAREKQKELGEETPQAKAKKRKEIARKFNGALKRALLKKRTPARRKKYALARSKAVAVQLISDNPELVAAGLRLVSDQFQQVEIKALKKGGNREIVTYATEADCTAAVLRRMMAAKDSTEVLEILSEALLAGILADDDECANKDRVRWYTPVAKEIERLLATEIKEIRPRRVRKPY